ncbi:MAG: cytochrome d ubiquinol oxidase subunit II [Sphingomicrobium sp.]
MDNVQLFLTNIWLAFLGLFLVLYVVLDGFDLGIGVLSLFVREKERHGIMVASLSSIWDANETWLVVLGGALFGAFPLAYGIALNAFYLPLITMLFALIFRGVAFEFREHAKHPRVWTFAFGGGSLVAALCQGFALGGLIEGPKVEDGRFVGGPFDWLSPFTMLVACGVVCGYVLLGSTYLIIKTEGAQQDRTYRPAWIAGALMLTAAAAISIWTPLRYAFVADKWFGHGLLSIFIVPPLFALVCAAMLARGLWKHFEYSPFFWTVGIFLASFTGLAASLYPFILPNAVTAMDAAADSMTLVFMLVGIGMLIPVMLAYNAYQYVVFRGKVTAGSYGNLH